MPFASRAQQKYLYAKHPEVAKEFASKTTDYKSLPEHVKSKTIKRMKERSNRA